MRRFQAGEIDSYADVPADQIPFIREHLKDEFQVAPNLGVYYFSFNTKKPPFDDVRVRNALSMVVDREFLADKIWGGAMLPGDSFVPPGIDNYGPPVMPEFHDLSPIEAEDKAKALLKAAGYGPGGKPLNVEIRFNTSENNKATSVAIADMWKALGVTTTFVNTDLKTHYALLAAAAITTSRARAGSATIPTRRTSSSCSRATMWGSTIPAGPIPPTTPAREGCERTGFEGPRENSRGGRGDAAARPADDADNVLQFEEPGLEEGERLEAEPAGQASDAVSVDGEVRRPSLRVRRRRAFRYETGEEIHASRRHGRDEPWACPGHPRRPTGPRSPVLLAPCRPSVWAARELNHVDGRDKPSHHGKWHGNQRLRRHPTTNVSTRG